MFPFKMSLQFVYSGCSQLTLRKQGYLAPLCILTLRTRKYHSRVFNLNMSLQFDCSSCSKFTLKTRISNYFFVFNFNVFFSQTALSSYRILAFRTRLYLNMTLKFDCFSCSKFTLKTKISCSFMFSMNLNSQSLKLQHTHSFMLNFNL